MNLQVFGPQLRKLPLKILTTAHFNNSNTKYAAICIYMHSENCVSKTAGANILLISPLGLQPISKIITSPRMAACCVMLHCSYVFQF